MDPVVPAPVDEAGSARRRPPRRAWKVRVAVGAAALSLVAGVFAMSIGSAAADVNPAAAGTSGATKTTTYAKPATNAAGGCSYWDGGWGVPGVQGWMRMDFCYNGQTITSAAYDCPIVPVGPNPGTGACTVSYTDPSPVYGSEFFNWTVQWLLCPPGGACEVHGAVVQFTGTGAVNVLQKG